MRGQPWRAWTTAQTEGTAYKYDQAELEIRKCSDLRLYSQIAEEPIGPRAQESEGEGRIAAEIPLSEERVKVGKRTVGAGEVRVRKNVSTEQVNVPVELKRENVVIEKIPGQQMEQTGGRGRQFLRT